jgi:hypothetical protein
MPSTLGRDAAVRRGTRLASIDGLSTARLDTVPGSRDPRCIGAHVAPRDEEGVCALS